MNVILTCQIASLRIHVGIPCIFISLSTCLLSGSDGHTCVNSIPCLQFLRKWSQRDMTRVISTLPSLGSTGWMSLGWVCCGTFPYFGLVTSSIVTGVGSFLGFAGTPHFLGSEVELGPPLLPWVACALLMPSTANIKAAV